MAEDIDDILGNEDKKKRKNSGAKGHRGELELAKILNKTFNSQEFSRTIGSGNRWSQVAYAKKDYIGDLTTPERFLFTLEVKHGYPEIDLYSAVCSGNATLDSWFEQAEDESERAGRSSLVCWRKERHEWLGFVKSNILKKHFEYEIKYRDWTGTLLANLLDLDKKFWFEK